MAIEKTLYAVSAQLFSANGGSSGQVTIPNAIAYIVKQKILIFSQTQKPIQLEVKRVTGINSLEVGPMGTGILDRTNLTAFTLSDGATIFAEEQSRPNIPTNDVWRAVFAEEPAVAFRTLNVDQLGNPYTSLNPLPVTIPAGGLTATVFLTSKDNDPTPGSVHSSIRIANQTTDLGINSDGSINVNIVSGGSTSTKATKNTYNVVAVVAMGVPTNLVSYTVPAGKTAILERVTGSGENIARYSVQLNNTEIDAKRTYFSGGLNIEFDYTSGVGQMLAAGDTVKIQVLHNRPNPGEFEARIQVVEIS